MPCPKAYSTIRTWLNANSIVHYPIGCFVDCVGIYIALAWKNKAFGHCMYAEREGKLKIKAYWNFR